MAHLIACVREHCPSPGLLEPIHGKRGDYVCTPRVIASRSTGILPRGKEPVRYSPLLWEWKSTCLQYQWLQTILLVFQLYGNWSMARMAADGGGSLRLGLINLLPPPFALFAGCMGPLRAVGLC